MKTIIIGGTRFLGVYITDALLKRGCEVILINRGNKEFPARSAGKLTQVACDKADSEKLSGIISAEAPRAVIDTILDADDLRALVPKILGVKSIVSFIHCGSVGVYAPARRIPSLESDRLEYLPEIRFNQKLEQDNVLMEMHRKHSFPSVILRITNVYGAGDVPLDIWGGRNPGYFARLANNEPVTVPENGMALLQPGYAGDLAEAFALAAEEGPFAGEIFNVGSHRAISLNDYAALHREIMKSKSEIVHEPREKILREYLPGKKVSERGLRFLCEHMCVDFSKIKKFCGYKPRKDMYAGFEENIEWLRKKEAI